MDGNEDFINVFEREERSETIISQKFPSLTPNQ